MIVIQRPEQTGCSVFDSVDELVDAVRRLL